jgi:hypothetical protein
LESVTSLKVDDQAKSPQQHMHGISTSKPRPPTIHFQTEPLLLGSRGGSGPGGGG